MNIWNDNLQQLYHRSQYVQYCKTYWMCSKTARKLKTVGSKFHHQVKLMMKNQRQTFCIINFMVGESYIYIYIYIWVTVWKTLFSDFCHIWCMYSVILTYTYCTNLRRGTRGFRREELARRGRMRFAWRVQKTDDPTILWGKKKRSLQSMLAFILDTKTETEEEEKKVWVSLLKPWGKRQKKKKKIALHKLQRVNFSRTVGLEILFPVYAVVRLRLISEYVLGKSCKRINGKWNRGVSGQSKSLVCAEFP